MARKKFQNKAPSVKATPEPESNERPTLYADRVGRWYTAETSPDHKKECGQYLTPIQVADFMGALSNTEISKVRILDPGAGSGILSCSICEKLAEQIQPPTEISLTAFETDLELVPFLSRVLNYLKDFLEKKGILLVFKIINEDFVLSHAACLDDSPKLFYSGNKEYFDIVISNPPYFKIPKTDPRARAASAVVHGQPNIYGLFMAISANLLSSSGELIFITPRSFASGLYFKRFREKLFEKITPKLIHVFESRRDTFNRDEILQENVIMRATRSGGAAQESATSKIMISCSSGISDLNKSSLRTVPLNFAIDMNSTDKVLRLPVSEEDDQIIRLIHSWTGSLRKYGLEISTGPVVPFRATPLLKEDGDLGKDFAPLIWMQHVKHFRFEWPLKIRKPQFIQISRESMPLLVADKNYVLLRRFSAKEEQRRLTAAAYISGSVNSSWIGLENHLNYIHRPKATLTEEEAWGLTALLSSSLYDKYFRAVNGNTQVSATELRALPLPPIELIVRLGKQIMVLRNPFSDIDALVMNELLEGVSLPAQLVTAHG